MTSGTTVTVIPCGAMTADLTWLLLAPGRAIRSRQNKHLPAEKVSEEEHLDSRLKQLGITPGNIDYVVFS